MRRPNFFFHLNFLRLVDPARARVCLKMKNYWFLSFKEKFKSASNQSGQSVIEMTLVLFLSVSLILGVVYQFNDAFKEFANNYFGDYLSCLLETGEIPSLGGPATAGICNQLYEPFELADGRPYAGNSAGGAGGVGGDDSRGGNNRGSSRGAGEGSSGGRSSLSRVSGGRSGGRFRLGENFQDQRGAADSSASEGDESSKKKTNTGDLGFTNQVGGIRNQRIPLRRSQLDEDDNNFGFAREEREREKREKPIPIKKEEQTLTIRNKKIPIKRNVATQSDLPEDEPMTFGEYFRYLIIAALLIALLLLLGGQALQITKSMDASD